MRTDTTGTAELIKRLRAAKAAHYEGYTADYELCAQAADALEEAERVIAPFAREADRYEPDEGDAHHDAWDSMFQIGHLRAARAWLARHATQRKGGEDGKV